MQQSLESSGVSETKGQVAKADLNALARGRDF